MLGCPLCPGPPNPATQQHSHDTTGSATDSSHPSQHAIRLRSCTAVILMQEDVQICMHGGQVKWTATTLGCSSSGPHVCRSSCNMQTYVHSTALPLPHRLRINYCVVVITLPTLGGTLLWGLEHHHGGCNANMEATYHRGGWHM